MCDRNAEKPATREGDGLGWSGHFAAGAIGCTGVAGATGCTKGCATGSTVVVVCLSGVVVVVVVLVSEGMGEV